MSSDFNNDTDKITAEQQEMLIQLLHEAYQRRGNNIAESFKTAKDILVKAQEAGWEEIKARAQNLLGLLLMITGDYKASRNYSWEALSFFEKADDKKGIADSKYNIASTFYKTDDFHEALQWFLDCLLLYRQLHDYYNESRVLKSMGTIYEYFQDTENAIESYEKSIDAARLAHDLDIEANSYNPLSGIYLKKGMIQQAMELAEKSITIKLATKDERGLSFSLYARGKVYMYQKEFEKACNDFLVSLDTQRVVGDKLGEGMVLNKLGLTYIELNQFDNAENILLSALAIGRDFNIKLIRYKICYSLYKLYKKQEKLQQAIEYLEEYINHKESIGNSHTYNVIKSYEAIHKLENIEREAKARQSYLEIVEKKNAELDSFFYRVSHDLKGPIASLMGLHNLIEYENFDSTATHYFEMYHSQLLRIHTIVMDLIELTRMSHIKEKNVAINFRKIAEDCVHSFVYHENYSRIRFIYEIDDSIVFFSQWIIINTILQNLIENSIKYSKIEGDSYVKIGVKQENRKIKLFVEDNGQGIHPTLQDRIFDMFFRANETSQGSGLGLYILKRAVERLDGSIELYSVPQVSTTFIVWLSENLPLQTKESSEKEIRKNLPV
jgi:hypothetical protein